VDGWVAKTPYPQGDFLRRAREVALPITGQQFVDRGHEPGPHIGELVKQERIRRIRRLKE
jgi:hypothetical protein